MRGDRNFKDLNQRLDNFSARLNYLERLAQVNIELSKIPKARGDLRLHQKANVVLLKKFTDFLDAHEISYWLNFGTLLGAVNYGGFVPWDDDIDISMTRYDYERLLKILPKWRTEKQWYNFCTSLLKIFYGNTNLFIDVSYYFQGDSEEVSDENSVILSRKLATFFDWNNLPLIPADERGEKDNPVSETWEPDSVRFFYQTFLENRAPIENGYWVLPISVAFDGLRCFIPHSKIFPLQKIKFEGLEFSAPNDIDFLLSTRFGDYLQVPKYQDFWEHGSVNKMTYSQKEELKVLLREMPELF